MAASFRCSSTHLIDPRCTFVDQPILAAAIVLSAPCCSYAEGVESATWRISVCNWAKKLVNGGANAYSSWKVTSNPLGQTPFASGDIAECAPEYSDAVKEGLGKNTIISKQMPDRSTSPRQQWPLIAHCRIRVRGRLRRLSSTC